MTTWDKSKFSPEKKAEIRKLKAQKWTLQELRWRFGGSIGYLSKICKEAKDE